jgi:predicted  nucleic acid-binding Zn-ribbon protein
MKPRVLILVPALLLAAACDTKQFHELAKVDSLRADSIVSVKNEMLDEVMQSTQFLNDINSEVAKLKVQPTRKLTAALPKESQLSAMRDERDAVTERIRELVARLDSSESRVASLRTRATALSSQDAQLTQQVAQFEKTIADLRTSLEGQRSEFQATVDRQNAQIAGLNSKLDTVTKAHAVALQANAQLTGEKAALTDTVNSLVAEKNTAYYVIGTRDELIKKGVLVEEGSKRLLLFGSRTVVPARDLDSAKFTRIDRLRDRQITLPAGDYTIFTRQSPSFLTASATHDGKLAGGLHINDPVQFWGPSKFLVLVKD